MNWRMTEMFIFWGILLIVIVVITFGFLYAHKDDSRLKIECEAAGGLFVQTREPLNICVQEIKNWRK